MKGEDIKKGFRGIVGLPEEAFKVEKRIVRAPAAGETTRALVVLVAR